MSLMPGAEPYHHHGDSRGVLLCHGFTGTPQSLRPWANHLARAGLSVELPLLPGHGTTWRDMAKTSPDDWYAELERALNELSSRCDEVSIMGLSLGGCLALRLAQRHPEVRALVLVNPSLQVDNKLLYIAPALRAVVPSVPGIVNDIKKPGMQEIGYARTPVRAAAHLPRLYAETCRNLAAINQPVLVFHSTEDHVVGPRSLEVLRNGIRAELLTVRECEDSFHVATLDNDADMIFRSSLEFVTAHAGSERG